jgi:hypothetical protein
MRHTPTLDTVRRALRARVCATCPRRTAGALLNPSTPLPCEAHCALFESLPKLRQTAVMLDPMVGNFRRAMRGMIRNERVHAPHGAIYRFDPLRHHSRRLILLLGEATQQR